MKEAIYNFIGKLTDEQEDKKKKKKKNQKLFIELNIMNLKNQKNIEEEKL